MILLVCVAIAPFLPGVIESGLKRLADREAPSAVSESASEAEGGGGRTHRISADPQGHFIAEVRLNGRFVEMLVDTGATLTALPRSLAEDIGIFLQEADFKYPVHTANGTALGAKATIDRLSIGDIRFTNVNALVMKDQSLGNPLLGMSVLNKLRKFDMSEGTLVLIQ
ncbi:TIGR02281 family clan AA aspartic protease [uncultured Roseibium sp.]|uniref:retropepsin-like aspartic protease family protein n=1 Tax=uncultured Roseibium sp. TaxID=1936171 RepID=UPI00260B4E10|nr:TIGR02281 family clan AA aspartic protease [uncultured Roseibium sp.]